MNFEIRIPIPIFGLGCGVLGLSMQKVSIKLGKYASQLLQALEYRGYDSTGAAFQGEGRDFQDVILLKDVGAPSTLVKTLKIDEQTGRTFCGQVRWATFGSVNKINAQPHVVNCKKFIYGAHNGNITNTRELKNFLMLEGHNVVSDNDGEMLVHTVEHYFDNELTKFDAKEQKEKPVRLKCMRKAIIKASQKMIGSYAAVIVDPHTETIWAIKSGSSLYFGIGSIDDNSFGLASSDLTAVLRFTKNLVNLREGEFIEFSDQTYQIFAMQEMIFKSSGKEEKISSGEKIERLPVRSKLRAEDTELLPQFEYFMEQEIYAETETTGKLIKLFQGGSNTGKRMLNLLEKENMKTPLTELLKKISDTEQYKKQQELFNEFLGSSFAEDFYFTVKSKYSEIYNELVKKDFEKKYFFSTDKNTFIELLNSSFDKKSLIIAKALDSLCEKQDVNDFNSSVQNFLDIVKNSRQKNRNVYTISCGTSYHASLIAAMFFNEIANMEIIPILPGNFRGQYSQSLRDDDVIIGVSQSGETKDLIDIFNDVDRSGLNIKKIVLVNNMNSTLGQEKSDVSIPIFCGPEIAVPATKSFINQITLFYYLAIKTAEMIQKNQTEHISKQITKKDLLYRMNSLELIPKLIQETIDTCLDSIDQMAAKIYMEPSMHLLATKMMGVAKEGALKIRETVLNHSEGGEASEFKHGPNTILGKNTVFGLKSVKEMIRHFNSTLDEMDKIAEKKGLKAEERRQISRALSDYIFTKSYPFNLNVKTLEIFKTTAEKFDFFEHAYRNYPLIYITGPEERDVNLTISQINTHKIRGGDSFVIAEENEKLLENASQNPHDKGYYGWEYINLPHTGDSLMTVFSAAVVLQLLALKMSVRKMAYLDRMGISDHGVHPDVPKNVSKSITVD
jgi:glucosamine 6-phosphate synthetase-like amidotransferase/phosphosugar isomerase protein